MSHVISRRFSKIEFDRVRAKGLYLISEDKLAQLAGFVGQAEPVLRDNWEKLTVESQLERIQFALAHLPPRRPSACKTHGATRSADAQHGGTV